MEDRIVNPQTGKGGSDMSIDYLAIMGLALIDLFWWLRK
jgi:hypothetical protein